MPRRLLALLALSHVRSRTAIAGLLLIGIVALVAPLASGTQGTLPPDVKAAWSIKVKNVRNLPSNPAGDDESYPDGVLCLYTDRTWQFLGFCDGGRWISDPKERNFWLQGGCEDFGVYTAIDFKVKRSGKAKGKIHEWWGDKSPYTHVAASHTATRNVAADLASACAAAATAPTNAMAPFLNPSGGR